MAKKIYVGKVSGKRSRAGGSVNLRKPNIKDTEGQVKSMRAPRRACMKRTVDEVKALVTRLGIQRET